jgi:FkbM family methyltransferase
MKSFFSKIANSVPLWLYCKLINMQSALRRKAHRIYLSDDQCGRERGIYLVRDKQTTIHLCRRSRNNMHKHGIQYRIDDLASVYLLTHIKNTEGGTLIDCGANIGELGLWAKKTGMNYIAFEPEDLEADCCDRNNYDGESKTYRYALWNSDEILTFYSRPLSADSSLLPSGEDSNTKKLSAKRLDSVINPVDLQHPAILKVEAEGAEPEVLEGAKTILPFLDYVTVDCGYERGDKNNPQHTFIETNKFLLDNNYTLIAANLRRGSFLFQRNHT